MQTQQQLQGLNVTIPYKEQIIPFLTEIDPAAAEIGAVNTIKIIDGKLHGYNTDCYGFEMSLRPLLQEKTDYKALIFGTGGAAKAVQYVFKKLEIPYQLVSRTPQKGGYTYGDLTTSVIQNHLLLINTTPLGMYPLVDAAPFLPYQAISTRHILYDLVYNPEKTLFLKRGATQGAVIKNGLEMLHLQAEKAWEIWTKK